MESNFIKSLQKIRLNEVFYLKSIEYTILVRPTHRGKMVCSALGNEQYADLFKQSILN